MDSGLDMAPHRQDDQQRRYFRDQAQIEPEEECQVGPDLNKTLQAQQQD
jgi:hypothetical protein